MRFKTSLPSCISICSILVSIDPCRVEGKSGALVVYDCRDETADGSKLVLKQLCFGSFQPSFKICSVFSVPILSTLVQIVLVLQLLE